MDSLRVLPTNVEADIDLPLTEEERAESGFAVFDKDLRLVAWNEAFSEIQQLPNGFADLGSKYEDFLRFSCVSQNLGIGETERKTADSLSHLEDAEPVRAQWKRTDDQTVNSLAIPIYGGGIVCITSLGEQGPSSDNFLANSVTAYGRHNVLDALDAMADGLALFDSEDRLIFCNNKFRQTHDRIADRLLPGLTYANLLKAAFAAGQFASSGPSIEEIYKHHKRARRGHSETFELELSDKRWLHCDETATSDGSTISVRSDISQIKSHAEELAKLSEQLKEQNLHFNTALNNMVQGLCLFDADQRLIVCNKRYLDMYGFSPDVVKPGIKLREIMEYSVSLGNYDSDEANNAIADRPVVASSREQSVLEQYLKDGRIIAVLHQPMEGGGAVATYEDITQRKNSERRLKEHADELERSNEELQNFANIASHDLQEPLRKIEAFSSRLQQKFSENLGDEGSQYVDRMQVAALRMRTLINDLLSYSRLTSKELDRKPCDLNKLLKGIVDDLEIKISETNAEINIDRLPTIHGSSTLLRQLFQNILTNSLKFTRDGVAPVIRITGAIEETPSSALMQSEKPVCKIVISDNGIGFEQKHADQIFGIFKRLHGRSAYDGTGIGLATCRKVVERHGGTIKAMGTPNVGAEFHIELPL